MAFNGQERFMENPREEIVEILIKRGGELLKPSPTYSILFFVIRPEYLALPLKMWK